MPHGVDAKSLKMRKLIFFSVVFLWANLSVFGQFRLTGVVLDANGNPVIGCVLTLKETFSKTFTDPDGRFSFGIMKQGKYTLQVDALGFIKEDYVINLTTNREVSVILREQVMMAEEYEVRSTRVIRDAAGISSQDIRAEEIAQQNLGQDLPILLNFTPSVVTTSDAGAGVGYTGIRIRGSDATRINVTVNGIPLNDAESQGVFWVNLPDLASSVNSIQIQRGVGTSTNGAGAFGGTINLQTGAMSDSAFAEVSNSFGSFNTRKHTVNFGTGWTSITLKGESEDTGFSYKKQERSWMVEGRLSGIWSDGYVNRASSNLRSYYLQGAYRSRRTLVRTLAFSGKERTYQSWWGVPEAILTGDRDALLAHYYNNLGAIYLNAEDSVNLFDSDRTYNYYRYDDQVDNYQQDHYQLHLTHQFTPELTLHAGLHYTYGRGYFEEFRYKDPLAFYGLSGQAFTDPGDTLFLPNPIIPGDTLFYGVFGDTTFQVANGNVIRRRWLDNDFYGGVYNLNWSKGRMDLTFGGGWNRYDGRHFGEVIWSEYAAGQEGTVRYYENKSQKSDGNAFLKGSYLFNHGMRIFADIQMRFIDYQGYGLDNGELPVDFSANYRFFNPKAGFSWNPSMHHQVVGLFAIANREPVRADFVDAQGGQVPESEAMINVELGYQYRHRNAAASINIYHMDYTNQLVLTGALNDVGAPVRQNVDRSFRSGVEVMAALHPAKQIEWNANFTFSINRIKEYTEVVYDYTNGFEVNETTLQNTQIAFSPSLIVGSQFMYNPFKGLELTWLTKYVGKQHLDNTSDQSKVIDPYLTNDIRLSYTFIVPFADRISTKLMVNNVLNTFYASNGYTYSYVFGETITENFYYPQAGINFLAGLSVYF